MKILLYFIFSILILSIISCQFERKRDKDELVLGDYIIEKNGVYYVGDCEIHSSEKYTGIDTFYFDNRKIKGTYSIKNGLPDGHWEQFNDNGTKKLDLYFENGNLTKKTKTN
jgi:antitoxin component YwqK of YwqJK toxin-antitoxin module